MHRPLTVAVGVVLALLLLPAVALAHASFDVSEVPAGAEQELVLRVPHERDAANERVEVLVPGAFTLVACEGADGWTCTPAETPEGDVVVTLERGPDGDTAAERFTLTVVTPSAQDEYAFPTVQTYDDGHEESWIGEADADQPAPRLRVGDQTVEVEPDADPSPHGDLAGPGSEDPAAAPSPAPTSPEPSPDAPSTPDAEVTPTPSEAADETVVEGGPSVTVLLVGVALLVVFALAVVVARSRGGA